MQVTDPFPVSGPLGEFPYGTDKTGVDSIINPLDPTVEFQWATLSAILRSRNKELYRKVTPWPSWSLFSGLTG